MSPGLPEIGISDSPASRLPAPLERTPPHHHGGVRPPALIPLAAVIFLIAKPTGIERSQKHFHKPTDISQEGAYEQ
jgi:hypothetical protein